MGKFSREYPDHWELRKVQDFVADCKREGRIPSYAVIKSKRIYRKKVVRLTWRW